MSDPLLVKTACPEGTQYLTTTEDNKNVLCGVLYKTGATQLLEDVQLIAPANPCPAGYQEVGLFKPDIFFTYGPRLCAKYGAVAAAATLVTDVYVAINCRAGDEARGTGSGFNAAGRLCLQSRNRGALPRSTLSAITGTATANSHPILAIWNSQSLHAVQTATAATPNVIADVAAIAVGAPCPAGFTLATPSAIPATSGATYQLCQKVLPKAQAPRALTQIYFGSEHTNAFHVNSPGAIIPCAPGDEALAVVKTQSLFSNRNEAVCARF